MHHKSLTHTRDVWLDSQATDKSSAAHRRRELLCQLCSGKAQWQHGYGYMYCTVACPHTSASKEGHQYAKFLRLLYLQGILEDGYLPGAYSKDKHSFELRLSEAQLEQMRSYWLALKRREIFPGRRAG